jgi:uncharacterized membrane protein
MSALGWLAIGGIAVILAAIGVVVVRLNNRERKKLDEDRARQEAVPTELREEKQPALGYSTLAAIAVGAVLGVIVLGDQIGARHAAVAGALILSLPLNIVIHRHRRAHLAKVRSRVEESAHLMTPAELEELLEGLEATYGRAEIKALRESPAIVSRRA